MKILLTGATGRLGTAFRQAAGRSDVLMGAGRDALGVVEAAGPCRVAAARLLESRTPDLVVNLLAMTSRRDCREHPASALLVNAVWPALLAGEARAAGVPLAQLSTDLVYSGSNPPYSELSSCVPRSVYGWTKLLGEAGVLSSGADALVVRTSVLFGSVSAGRPTFSEEILSARGGAYTAFRDSWRHHTPIHWFSRALLELVRKGCRGLVLLASSQACSREEFACSLLEHTGVEDVRLLTRSSPRGTPTRLRLALDRAAGWLEGPLPDASESIAIEYPADSRWEP